MRYDLSFFDDERCRLEPIDNPSEPESITHMAGIIRHLCDRNRPSWIWLLNRGSNLGPAD